MKIDWPVVCAFILLGCMIGLSGQRLDNPSTAILFAVFLVALIGPILRFLYKLVRGDYDKRVP